MLFEWENSIEHITELGKLVWEWVEQGDFEMNTECEIFGAFHPLYEPLKMTPKS